MELTVIFSSFTDRLCSSLSIEVDYSPEDMTVTEILKVTTTDHSTGIQTDITELMLMNMNAGLEEVIQNTDWWKLYCDSNHYAASRIQAKEE